MYSTIKDTCLSNKHILSCCHCADFTRVRFITILIISNTAKVRFTVNLKSLQTQLLYTLEVCTFSEKLLANLSL